ncbi:MAG: hypothetical protein AAGA99_04340 [Actinomycetota bacterium]
MTVTLTGPTGPTRGDRWRAGVRRLAFVLVSATIMAIVSERMYWYWDPGPADMAVVVGYYAVAVGTTLWTIDPFRVRSTPAMVMVAVIYGMIVEGILTPVAYSGGPLPIFPAYFTGWHGLLGVVVVWWLLHRWLLDGRRRSIALASGALGVLWGVWAFTSVLPENVQDPELIEHSGTLELLGPGAFTLYAFGYTALLALAHWLWGRLGPVDSFRPSRPVRWLAVAAMAAMLIAYTVGLPWAAPMFAVFVGGAVWFLRREAARHDEPSVLADLVGPVRARHLPAMLPLPVLASAIYAASWWLEPEEAVVRLVMWVVIAATTLVGGGAVAWAAGRTLHAPASPAEVAGRR